VHLEETKGQQDRLKQLISDLGILSQSLSEERSMADWIKTNMPDMVVQLWPEIEASIATVEGE
jgi:ferritin-like metal-binding protein YciE